MESVFYLIDEKVYYHMQVKYNDKILQRIDWDLMYDIEDEMVIGFLEPHDGVMEEIGG